MTKRPQAERDEDLALGRELERKDAEIDRLKRAVDFVALWCYRKTMAGDHERLSVITFHPVIRAAAKANGFDVEQKADK